MKKKRANFKLPRKESVTKKTVRKRAVNESERMSDSDRRFNGFLPASHWKEDE